MHNITVWAAWPMDKKQESKHAEEVDYMITFFLIITFWNMYCRNLAFPFISPYFLFPRARSHFKRKGNVYLNECTSVDVLQAPPEGYFTERKLMMQIFGPGNSRPGFKSNETSHLQTKEQNAQGNLVWKERGEKRGSTQTFKVKREQVSEIATSRFCSFKFQSVIIPLC